LCGAILQLMSTAVAQVSRLRAARPARAVPAGKRRERRSSALDAADRVTLDFLTAPDVRSGMERVVATLCVGGVKRIEWWAPSEDGARLQLEATAGRGRGRRSAIPLGPAGALVVAADRWTPQLVASVDRLAPVLRRRWTEEQLAQRAVRLTLQNEALSDFASLAAHELKTPLHAALLHEDPSAGIAQALELIDTLLDAARAESTTDAVSSPRASLDEALRDLGAVAAEVSAELPDHIPFPAAPLRVVLRNLLTNALRAGAQRIEITSAGSDGTTALCVDDDGVGLEGASEYSGGCGLGLGLIRRLAGRYGATVELLARPTGGTRAMLVMPGAALAISLPGAVL
jgi:signal transduction histidine kinase